MKIVVGTTRVIGLLLFLVLASTAQQKPANFVNLTVMHDGQEKSSPDQITVTFDNHSIQIPVQEGKFEVPPEVANSKEVTLSIDIEHDHIQVPGIPGIAFERESWKLLLAERSYSVDFQWAVPNGTRIHNSCVLVVDSKHANGWVMTVPKCRSRRK